MSAGVPAQAGAARDTATPPGVVVVGGGLAGAVAALELAAREVPVTLVRAAPGASALGWGSLDVAAASPGVSALPWRDALRGEPLLPSARLALLLRTRPTHPYATLFQGEDAAEAAAVAVKVGASSLDAWLAGEGLRVEGSLDASRLLANLRGALRVTDFAFSGPADGDVASAGEIVLADVPALAGYDARPAARALAAELAALGVGTRPIRVAKLVLPPALQALAGTPARLAAALDDEAAQGELACAAAALRASLPARDEGRLLLWPAILGLARTARALAALREATGARVAELLGAAPTSPAGLRLDRALLAALARRGVAVIAGRARAVESAAGRATALDLESAGAPRRLRASAVVLASGRFVGGGLGEREGLLCETLLGLPVYDERGQRVDRTRPRRLVAPGYADAQPLYGCGVVTDRRLRPLAPNLQPALANLFAAGDLLGGFDPARERTGLGVALLSGLRAASEAARAFRESAA